MSFELIVQTVRSDLGIDEPRSFRLGERRTGVVDIIDRWLSYSHSYFKVRADDGATYILRHDLPTGQWEMTLFQVEPVLPLAVTVGQSRMQRPG
ncbi:MAG TPA: hypothetical protein VM491_12445 [Burkholderiaceae bacterium]|nr:hypothetical protein [Burkholderiaceae bacterium]